MSKPRCGANESRFLQNAREVIIRVGELVLRVFESRGEKRYWFRFLLLLRIGSREGENLIISIHNNHFLKNEDEIPEAKPRVPEDEQKDDDD
ncbi:hypothetical protein HID58_006062 [Brassica napus]|uniref:Uncharacterized protein n=1 Tax=Brassica napus TaxID=3708 RepID=A0ABQ8EDA1_BRANA|nr:hypothetical protein HID58_006062 [Brassica napus]